MPETHPTTPQHQLPDFKPKGMTVGDKIAMWTLIFIVVIFSLVQINRVVGAHVPSPGARPTATASAKATPSVKIGTRYVVINTANGYIWVLDNNGSHFTLSSAKLFIEGHPTYRIETLAG
jgi:hypothetical protein